MGEFLQPVLVLLAPAMLHVIQHKGAAAAAAAAADRTAEVHAAPAVLHQEWAVLRSFGKMLANLTIRGGCHWVPL